MIVEVTNKIDSALMEQIQILASQKDITEQELITELLIDSITKLQKDTYKVPEMLEIDESKEALCDINEIKELLGHDKNKSKINLNDYLGIISSPQPRNSLEEKRQSYNRR